MDSYHRFQIHALTSGYYNVRGQQLVGRVKYHYSELAESGAIAKVSRQFSAAKAFDLGQIMRLPNLPPHPVIFVERGTKTTVNVYADRAYQQSWAVILESLGP